MNTTDVSMTPILTILQPRLHTGLLIGYGAGASMNLTLMLQGIIYREQTGCAAVYLITTHCMTRYTTRFTTRIMTHVFPRLS